MMPKEKKIRNGDFKKIMSTLLFGIMLILMIALASFLTLMLILYSI